MAPAVDGALNRRWRLYQQPVVLAVTGALIVTAAVLPLLQLLADLPAALPLAHDILGNARPWLLLLRSLGLSCAVVATALALGIPFGVLIARFDVMGRRALWVLQALPMFLPPFVLALGWFYLFGRGGLIGNGLTSRLLFGNAGYISVLALAFAPVATSLVAFGIRGVDASLEDAARMVARPGRVVARILVPAARPALTLAAIVIFSLAFSELGVAMFLRVDVFQAMVFARLGGIDFAPGEALVLLLPLLPLAGGLLLLERRFGGGSDLAVAGLRGGARPPMPLGIWRVPLSLGCWLLTTLSMAPVFAVAYRAARAMNAATLLPWLGKAPITSLSTAACAGVVVAAIGLVVGHSLARRGPGSAALDAAAVLSFLMPSALLGIGLVGVWNRTATTFVYGSVSILVIGYVARYVVVGIRCVAAEVLQSPANLEEAAAVAGAPYLLRLWRIVLPLGARAIAFSFLMVLVFCLRDLDTPVIFYPAGYEPLTVRLFTLEANGPQAVIAALALTQVVMTLLALMLGYLCIPKRRRM